MKTLLAYGALLGVLVAAWMFVMGWTGWYHHPVLMRLSSLVIPLQIALLIGMLSRTAAAGRGYGGQVVAGTLASVVGAVIVAGASLLLTSVVFPHYFDELHALHENMMRAQGLGEAEIAAALALDARSQMPLPRLLPGTVVMVTTGLVTSLVAGSFIRARR